MKKFFTMTTAITVGAVIVANIVTPLVTRQLRSSGVNVPS